MKLIEMVAIIITEQQRLNKLPESELCVLSTAN